MGQSSKALLKILLLCVYTWSRLCICVWGAYAGIDADISDISRVFLSQNLANLEICFR